MTRILEGKPVAAQIYEQIRSVTGQMVNPPNLTILQIGNNPAADFYVRNLTKKGSKAGIRTEVKFLEISTSESELLNLLDKLNKDSNVNGIMIQKPLPLHINEAAVNQAIDPNKDVDGFHPINIGKMILDQDSMIPSTPAAVLQMIRYYNLETTEKTIVILGRSNIVGKPLANLLLRKDRTGNATVIVCHSKTKNIESLSKQADILVAAIGSPEFVKAGMIKKNAVIIDVGVNQVGSEAEGYRYVGDVAYEECFEIASQITPVPGGVGTVTTAMLLKNVIKSLENDL